MRHILLKTNLLLLMLFIMTGLQAQRKLYIQAKDGTKSAFPLYEIRKVIFPSSTLIVVENNGNTQSFPFADLRQARFTQWLSGNNTIDLQENKGLVLFPNPVGEELTLRLAAEPGESIEIRILDVKGNTVYMQTGNIVPGINQIKMQLSHLVKGIYVCLVNRGKTIETSKFMKY